jgi:hypothetical protein
MAHANLTERFIGRMMRGGAIMGLPVVAMAVYIYCMSARDMDASLLTVGDAFGYLSLGTLAPATLDFSEAFKIPHQWLSYYLLLFFAVAWLVRPKPSTVEYLTFFGLQSRARYWSAVFTSALIYTIFYFLVTIGTLAILVLAGGGTLTLQPSLRFCETFLQGYRGSSLSSSFFASAFLLPLLASCSLVALETLLIYCLDTTKSFICLVVVMVASAYFQLPFLQGNYLMLLRGADFVFGGIPTLVGILLSIALVVGTYAVGCLRIRAWDFLSEKRS